MKEKKMGGKSRKMGSPSKKLIERIKGKKGLKSTTKSGFKKKGFI